ncbi:YigZ family protein [Pedobacter hiemivivus]|uniref:YigZ family protein n=1 Tax=Pedobacter hiemivivus TaxID=2530454 RepID=A0A4R0MGY9_9SPHI|nr:YigZ family protein [Pedobacter hiemivivus]TCC85781.1 YigZ family protein [Pedobacter hiemivivus]TKC57724.1 YigZ family protein [Pedobacter hiemivivus]
MLFDDTYKTIAGPSEGVFRDRGSKFIGYAYPILSEEEVKAILLKLRSEHAKARHFCWALRLSPDRGVFRIQDDGEPSGTAGRPILNTMLSADVTNILIVVVRYFGGTLLGVPGLINAYKTAAVEALQAAEIIEKTVNDIYELQFDYLVMNDVMRLIKEEKLNVLSQDFDNACSIKIEIRKASLNSILGKIEKVDGLKAKYLFTA